MAVPAKKDAFHFQQPNVHICYRTASQIASLTGVGSKAASQHSPFCKPQPDLTTRTSTVRRRQEAGHKTHFSSTSTLAPLAAMRAAVVRPPIPLPMMTASYSTSVGACPCSGAAAGAGRLPVGATACCAALHTCR